jgi:hypothetical protein
MPPVKIWVLVASIFLLLEETFALPHFRASRSPNPDINDDLPLSTIDETFTAMVNALEVMQSTYWDQSTGTWPTGIDWTSAVFGTHLSATLNEMANYEAGTYSNEINTYFSQVVSFYTGENAISLRTQKFDDMQWVVLEWLEAIKFVNLYSSINSGFIGQQYVAEFAHRARIFWDLAAVGYDNTLCGGGMVWTDQLTPYKNAITNQLFMASSIAMYLYFPGDDNPEPYSVPGTPYDPSQALPPATAHDVKYLNAAIKEYNWLTSSGMTNSQGLYVDGFHITGWVSSSDIGTGKCDSRDESVYTYNQGVFLSGVRGLWEATGDTKYLNDGYTLIQSVIAATGWTSATQQTSTWSGLGSSGILQDLCDVDGSCSQDSQNFKGIFFHHLALFCQPLSVSQKETSIFSGTTVQAQAHQTQCNAYLPWIQFNAQAAYSTLSASGIYGGWWDPQAATASPAAPAQPSGASDYKNKGIPQNTLWRLSSNPFVEEQGMSSIHDISATDPNDRGRGRTVETQSGGLAAVRCLLQGEYLNAS